MENTKNRFTEKKIKLENLLSSPISQSNSNTINQWRSSEKDNWRMRVTLLCIMNTASKKLCLQTWMSSFISTTVESQGALKKRVIWKKKKREIKGKHEEKKNPKKLQRRPVKLFSDGKKKIRICLDNSLTQFTHPLQFFLFSAMFLFQLFPFCLYE